MIKKKISQLDPASASLSGIVPMSDSAGTVTNKVTIQSILDLSNTGLSWSAVPSLPSSSGTAGDIARDANYFYTAVATNTWRRVPWQAWETDPYFANVALLLKMNGVGTSFTDSSSIPKTITPLGDVIQSTAQAKFGDRSAYFNGNSALKTSVPFNAATFGSNDFVIECWYYITSFSNYTWLLGARDAGIVGGVHFVYYEGTWKTEVSINGSSWLQINNLSVPINQWFHYAFVRDNGILRVYINGVAASSTQSVGSSTFIGDSGGITLFAAGSGLGSGCTGYADEFRITIGSNRGYTGSTIVVPTAQFPDS